MGATFGRLPLRSRLSFVGSLFDFIDKLVRPFSFFLLCCRRLSTTSFVPEAYHVVGANHFAFSKLSDVAIVASHVNLVSLQFFSVALLRLFSSCLGLFDLAFFLYPLLLNLSLAMSASLLFGLGTFTL